MALSPHYFRRMVLCLGLLCSCFFESPTAEASSRIMQPLQITTYSAPTNDLSVTVEPGERYGKGPSTMTSEMNGEELWSKEIPFTFYRCVISEEGFVTGYAYTNSIYGRGGDQGELVIAVLNPEGDVVYEKRFERTFSGFLHSSPYPVVNIFDVSYDTNSALFFMREKDLNEGGGELLCINYKTQEEQLNINLLDATGDEKGRILNLKYIHPYPLIAVAGQREGSGFRFKGPRTDIINMKGESLWSWFGEEDTTWWGFNLNRGESGEILFMEDETTLHRVQCSADQEGWKFEESIEQVEKTEEEEEKKKEETPEVAQIETQPIAVEVNRTFQLDVDRLDIESTKIGYLRTFDDKGILYTLEREEGSATLNHRNSQGEIVASWPMDLPEGWSPSRFQWLREGRFLLEGYQKDPDKKNHRALKIFDTTAGELEPIEGIKSWGVGEVNTNNSGYILVRSYKTEDINSGGHIRVIDEAGNVIVTIPEEQFSRNCGNCKARAACITNDNEIAVLSTYQDRVIYLDLEGNILREHFLKEIWGYEPNYLADIFADPDGGVFVKDFNGKYPIVRMSKDGVVLEKYVKNGVPDSNGNIWGHDGFQMLRYQQDGSVDKTIGTPPSEKAIGAIHQMVVDQNGYIYILPRRTGIVHVFDESGRLLYKCDSGKPSIPEPENSQMSLLVYPDRSVDLLVNTRPQSSEEKPRDLLYKFDANGSFLPDSSFPDGILKPYPPYSIQGNISPLVFDDTFFLLRYQELQLIHTDTGEIVHSQEKDFDRKWLGFLGNPFQSPDGRIMIQNRIGTPYTGMAGHYTIFSSVGEPTRFQKIPAGVEISNIWHTAWDGEYIFTLYESRIVVIDEDGNLIGHLDFGENPTPNVHRVFLTKGGEELWLFDGEKSIGVIDATGIQNL